MPDLTRFRQITIATLVVGYVLVILGGIVRVEGAGMGCGDDWPICNGEVIPTFSYLTTLEYLHRVVAGIVTLLSAGVLVAAWRLRRQYRPLLLLAAAAFTLVIAQALLGAVTVFVELEASAVTAHLGMAMTFMALTLVIALLAYRTRLESPRDRFSFGPASMPLVIAAGAVFVLLLTGAYTAASAAAWACPEWPTCQGNYVPTGTSAVDIHLLHRWTALIALGAIIWATVHTRRSRFDSPAIIGLTAGASALLIAQVFVGAMNIWFELASWVRVTHLGVATLVWGALVAAIMIDALTEPQTAGARSSQPAGSPRPARAVAHDYITTMKPGVLALLLVTTLAAMLVAVAGLPPVDIMFWTLVGGVLSAGGAGAINHYIDRDIDALMTRTSKRPLPSGRIPPIEVAIFGIVLSVLSVMVLVAFVNLVAAMLALAGNLFYVFVYTLWLKRRTPQNIVIGGAAGSIPPMVGWAAATGGVGVAPLLMFGLIFFWTPPHFWSLALFKRTDYSAAGVPMMPAARGEVETRQQIVAYTIVTVVVSILLYFAGGMGVIYLSIALFLGAIFIKRSADLYRSPDDQVARGMFLFSMQYLGLLFIAMVADRLIGL